MNTKPIENVEPVEDPNALLEKALIEEYLKGKGYSHEDLKKLPVTVQSGIRHGNGVEMKLNVSFYPIRTPSGK